MSRGDRPKGGSARFLNLLVAGLGLIVLAPLMVLIGIAVAITSRGPIFYRQVRVGRDRRRVRGPRPEEGRRTRTIAGREVHSELRRLGAQAQGRRTRDAGGRLFTMYKFRSMTHRPVASSPEVWALQADSRITPIGSRLRKHRLDEVPQLFNVLRGDMNVVGPRPEQPQLFLELRDQVDGYAERQAVLPGITGWAQINHPYDRSIDDVRRKVELDLQYLSRRSASEDLRIMARTLPVMISTRGAH